MMNFAVMMAIDTTTENIREEINDCNAEAHRHEMAAKVKRERAARLEKILDALDKQSA